MPFNKIIQLQDLASKLEILRRGGKKVVHCHGVFDLLHIGHIRHFREARQYGDILVVTLTPDRYVDKGPNRPAFNENLRAEAVASLAEVDFVAINQWPTAEETLRVLRPDFYAKGSEFKSEGSDFTGKINKELETVNEIGCEMVFTEDIVFSSSNIINRFLADKPKEISDYIKLLRKRHSIENIHAALDRMSSLKVLVIGDSILDDYQYCEALGKSNKDPVLAVLYKSSDLFAGGVMAVTNHVANFAGLVKLVSVLGEHDSYEDFIRGKLHPGIDSHFVVQPGAPTLIKRRYLDGYSFNKLLEVYIMNNAGLPPDRDTELRQWVEQRLPDIDLVIAADFGHGAISDSMVRLLCESKCFLAVNTQANAGNRGFHTISRYSRANFVCLAEHEIRLDMRNMLGQLRPMMDELAERLSCQALVVTRGSKGALVRGRHSIFVASPSLTMNIVDRIGAGDAFFAVTALAARLGVDDELLGFIGNVVGSLAVGVIGNQKPIDKMSAKKYITALLK